MAVAKSNNDTEFSFRPFQENKVLCGIVLDPQQSSTLRDRYVLGEELGWGQFGIIRSCSDTLTGELLACKSIAKDRLVTQEDVRSVKLEIEIMTRLSGHPNVVDLKAVYEEEDHVHLVMELCAGGELFCQLEKRGRFSEKEARVLFRQLLQVVRYCHDEGIVHRDLKPENILLISEASCSPIKLADFGLATYIKPGQNLHGTVGSPFYIAPEVLAGDYNQVADIWSAGVILYILLSGVPPFWGKTKSRIFNAVRAADLQFPSDPWDFISHPAKELIRGMLCIEPSQRLTAQQVLDHAWIRDTELLSDDSYEDLKHNYRTSSFAELDIGSGSLCSFMTRNQDISFGIGSPPIISCKQPPALTCRSSFSFLADPLTPCLGPAGFSFRGNEGSDDLEFISPAPLIPSFAFFSPGSTSEQGNFALDFSDSTQGDTSIRQGNMEPGSGKLFVSPDSSQCSGHEKRETDHIAVESRSAEGTSGSRMSAIHSRRNHTIGLGEFNQLDFMVTESIIRWASCTHLPTATSLRSSLVC